MRICVFCASSPGAVPEYAAAARATGRVLAERNIGVVYGGGNVGLMGALADATLAAGGEVIGVIPKPLVDREVAHTGLTRLHVVSTMHERKQLMHDLSDAFIALPGGFGTFEELFETLTWGQLGMHRKPCGLYNVLGYYDPLLQLLEGAVKARLLRPEHRALLLDDTSPDALLAKLATFEPPAVTKWIDRGEE
jgi:uncharacterized protein (TIGR00730 family)